MSVNRTVALVGRPNVGKSRLFNRLTGRRLAIVHDQPGVTRDVNAYEVEDPSGVYTLLDTGGIGLQAEMSLKELIAAAEEQVFVAVEAAQVICLVVDAKDGLTPLDEMIADRIRTMGKKPILVVNKIDAERHEAKSAEFARLGFGAGIAVSAEHGLGEDALRKVIARNLPPAPPVVEEPEARRIRVCFTGRPNVGKSSLCNRLLNNDRLVVSEVPGTTRDAVELDLDYRPEGREDKVWPFRMVDTAGIRRRTRVDTPVEYFSALRSQDAIQNSDVVFLVLDALEGVSKQDQTILGEILNMGRSVVVLVNKWDLALETFKDDPIPGYEGEREFREKFEEAIRKELFFLPDSPVVFVSAKTGFSIERILKAARALDLRMEKKLSTPKINKVLEKMFEKRAPRKIEGRRFKAYYAVQTGNRPFQIRVFCNKAQKLEDNYRRYLERAFIAEFELQGCPIRFDLVGKPARYSEKR